MSFGLSGKIDGVDRANEGDGIEWKGGNGKIACKAFSKSLIVRAIHCIALLSGEDSLVSSAF